MSRFISVKITLNDSIPESRRPQVERLVNTLAGKSEILWLPSRFSRLVMLIEPGPAKPSDPEKSSMFEPPQKGMIPTASMTAQLEDRITACLAKPQHLA
jgi:hypothetical protein